MVSLLYGKLERILGNKYMNKKVVVTVNTDPTRFKILAPEFSNPDWDYVCFTNNKDLFNEYCQYHSYNEYFRWQFQFTPQLGLDNKKLSRMFKVCTHKFLPNYEEYLYVDSKFSKCPMNLNEWKDLYDMDNYDLMVMKHPKRNCIYAEGRAIVSGKLDSPSIIDAQLATYKNVIKMPERFGLWAPGIMWKKNNELVNTFMENWWKEIMAFSYRDILSLAFIRYLIKDKNIKQHYIKILDLDFREITKQFYGA